MYIAAMLKSLGHDVKWLNHNLWDFDLREELKGRDVAMFTGFEEFRDRIIRDSRIAMDMGLRTVLGGALATFEPMEMSKHVDAVVVGEGENAVSKALKDGWIIKAKPPHLSCIPYPDYEGFGIDEYNKRHSIRWINVLTSRGCPGSCIFCAQTCQFQMRDLLTVFDEIDRYRELYNPAMIVFEDNTMNINKDRWLGVCEGMAERKLSWGAAIRCTPWDEEMARKAVDSGLQYVIVGVESFNQEKLDRINKRMKVENIFRCLDSLQKHGIKYHGNILVGFPWESYADIFSEMESIPDGLNIFPAMVQPFIGTQCRGRNITEEQEEQLDRLFRTYAESRNMTWYSGVKP
jgi:radical SAM superfamily enzyme YgiQ (UPF0313 family)